MGCVRPSDAQGRSHKQPKTTHEVSRELEVANQKDQKVAKLRKLLFYAPGPSAMAAIQ